MHVLTDIQNIEDIEKMLTTINEKTSFEKERIFYRISKLNHSAVSKVLSLLFNSESHHNQYIFIIRRFDELEQLKNTDKQLLLSRSLIIRDPYHYDHGLTEPLQS